MNGVIKNKEPQSMIEENTTESNDNIMIIDDHPVTRQGIASLVNQHENWSVVCESSDGKDVLELIHQHHVDLVILDLSLPMSDGLELIIKIRKEYQNKKILVLSMHDEALYAERAMGMGANGYVMKHEGGQVLVDAIETILQDKRYLSESMQKALSESDREKDHASGNTLAILSNLTTREFTVFQLLGDGMSSKDIAKQLGIGVKTVETYRMRLKQKLGLSTARELMYLAVRWRESRKGLCEEPNCE